MGLTSKTSTNAAPDLPEAGELLGLQALDRSGLAITNEGALVRIIKVRPPNPYMMSQHERAMMAQAFSQIISRLSVDQTLQFYVEARPVPLKAILENSRREVEAWAGPPPMRDRPARDALALSRWRGYAAMEEGMRLHADDQAALELSTYVVVPYRPTSRDARAVLGHLSQLTRRHRFGLGGGADLSRGIEPHRRVVRASQAYTDAIRGDLEALNLPAHILNGEEVFSMLWARFNPTRADRLGRPTAAAAETVGRLDAINNQDEAQRAAAKLRGTICQSGLDFRARDHVVVDQDMEQVIYARSTVESTYWGWLAGAMHTRQPFSLSVFVHGLDRRSERAKLKGQYRRTLQVNRTAAVKGRAPDFDRLAKERETGHLLDAMANQERASIFYMSIYQSVRARGPQADAAALAEAVDYCADQLESASDCTVDRGSFQQHELWPSTLPLGRDVAGRSQKYVTRNVGDSVPLHGTACGSPNGMPFLFSDPGRELMLLDPYDRVHSNSTLVISGESGSGKGVAANTITSRFVDHGGQVFIIDRSGGHYATLAKLKHGGRHISVGAEDSKHYINPYDTSDLANVPGEKISFLISLHEVMLSNGISDLERAQLDAGIRNVYARCAALGETPSEHLLRDELVGRSEEARQEGLLDLAGTIRNLAERLGPFCEDGAYAHIADRATNVPADGPVLVFDTSRCPDGVLGVVIFATLEYITRRVLERRQQYAHLIGKPGAPMFAGRSALVIDEGWKVFEDEELGGYANDLARRARHLGLFLIVMSQLLSDFATQQGRALLRNSRMHLLMAMHPDEVSFVQEVLRLSAEQARTLRGLKTVKGSHAQALWINGTRGSARGTLRLGPIEQWAYTSDEHDAPIREAKIAELDGDVWAAVVELAASGPPLAAAA
jgi:ABC-type oligopeptide transport system ATPase subunit